MWSLARVHLGLTDAQFYLLTPRQLHLLIAQHRERVEHQELMAGVIASTVANFSMSRPKKPLKPSDFMPSRRDVGESAAKPQTRVNRKRVADQIRLLMNSAVKAQERAAVAEVAANPQGGA